MRTPSSPAQLTTNPSVRAPLTICKIRTQTAIFNVNITRRGHLSGTLSKRASNCILLDSVHLVIPFIPLLYCTESYISCFYILSHIPQLWIFVTANGIYTQPGQESLFPEESKRTPGESSQSSLSIKYLPSNYLPSCIILRMTNIPDFINEAGWWYRSGHRWW
jgi:hypothetical protein